MGSLATKYRPQKFEDVTSQESVIKILERQLALKQFSNNYLFCGSSGVGKTTLARIFANEINQGASNPIEIDAASNNGVDNVKAIVKDASERSLSGEYKIIIMDEAHMLTTAAWNAFLKCIEEPPKYTIFMFCTTDPQKIPATIVNRVMRFNLTRIGSEQIKDRLIYICQKEGYTNFEESCDYISRICGGGMRDAISLLEKCANYDTNLSIDNTLNALGDYSYDIYFTLIDSFIDGNVASVISIVDSVYNKGNDLKIFLDKFTEFCLDLTKYSLTKNIQVTKIPTILEDKVKYCTTFSNGFDAGQYYFYVVEKLVKLKTDIRYDVDIKTTMEVGFINIARMIP